MMLTLLAGFTRVVYQSGLFCRLISYLVTSAFASCNASSTCNKSNHLTAPIISGLFKSNPLSKWADLQGS